MGNQDWSNLGDQIKNTVQSAIDSQNFRQLNDSIRNSVNSAIDNVNQSLNQANQRFNRGNMGNIGNFGHPYSEPQNPWDSRKNRNRDRQRSNFHDVPAKGVKNELISRNSGMKGAGYSLTIVGYILAGSLGLATFIIALVSMISGGLEGGAAIAIGVIFPFLLASIIMAWRGSKILGRLKRFKLYVRQLRGREYCSVKELADAVGKPVNYTVKDLREMIRKNMFCQGHIDAQESCLMITDQVYNQYMEAQHQMEIRQREEHSRIQNAEAVKKEQKAKMEDGSVPEDVRKVVEEGQSYLDKIKKSNDAIPGVEVSEKISRMEVITTKIFERVEQHPEHIPDLRKFMEYYLPTTVKLLDAYEELDRQPVQGENILTSKREIEDTLDTINMAFEKLLDGFFQDTSWDISSDISVLQTMFAQEGLTGQDFKKARENTAKKQLDPENNDEIKLKF